MAQVEPAHTVKKQRRAYRKMIQSQTSMANLLAGETLEKMEWHIPMDYDLGATQLLHVCHCYMSAIVYERLHSGWTMHGFNGT